MSATAYTCINAIYSSSPALVEDTQVSTSSLKEEMAQTWLPQSGPPYPSKQSQLPRLQTPCPEQKLRSEQESSGWMVFDRQVLQHRAGAIGTRPMLVILHFIHSLMH